MNRAFLQRGLRFALALLVLGTGPAAADFKETYAKGIEAVQRRSWSEVARLMQSAIQEHPQANRGIRGYGMDFQPYVPYYYLGLARAEMSNCDGAVAAWRTSEGQGDPDSTRRRRPRAQPAP